MNSAIAAVVAAKARADESVDYSPMDGAVCPECQAKNMPVVTSRKWKDGLKVRFHHCQNKETCLLGIMEVSIKSVQAS